MNTRLLSTTASHGSTADDRPIERFREAIASTGLVPPEHIEADGRLHRFHVAGDKPGSRNGWYVLHLDRHTAGAFGTWKLWGTHTWSSDQTTISAAQQRRFARLVEAARAKEQAERQDEQAARAVEAQQQWELGSDPDRLHPYLVAKAVRAHALRQHGVALLVPLVDEHLRLWNVQRIFPDGSKLFHRGRAGGLFCPIGRLEQPGQLLICEGWATGSTLHDSTGHAVLCAMSAHNLVVVARAARATWPDAELTICADNDWGTPGNPGVTAATSAAKTVGARLAIPEFPDGTTGTDFNDLARILSERRAA
jgi:putative DNA primase/helicase